MSTAALQPLRIAIAGNPNCGKTALFNAITGSRQKVGNYPGVTVERKEGVVKSRSGRTFSVLDLPGTYSLDAKTPDEEVTRDVLFGKHSSESSPEALIAVVDATNLERNLGLFLELRTLKKPMVLALNMMDLAEKRGLELDLQVLSQELGVAVVPTVATHKKGITELLSTIEHLPLTSDSSKEFSAFDSPQARFREVDRILKKATRRQPLPHEWTKKIDNIVLHPVWGTVFLLAVLMIVFQAIFSFAKIPMEYIQSLMATFSSFTSAHMAEGPLRSLIVDGVIAGVGSVIVFLPQILILFGFLLFLEDSGYMARAAFLMDKLMGRVGLHGRAFIPLLSSFACAIPGIMATRTIENRRDRLTTILIAPFMTCSARLPVYSLLIAAFIPDKQIFGPLHLQGLVMLSLYLFGIFAALGMALVFRSTLFRGPKPILLFELPTYKWPSWRNVTFGLFERARLFLRRAGTVILSLSVILWFLASYPKPPTGATDPAINYSYAGKIGQTIAPLVEPIGFNWKIAIALIPGFAAREVMISALGTVYSIEAGDDGDAAAKALAPILSKQWSLATALSLLVWYVLACQCLSTLAVTRRETNSWRWPAFMLFYMTVLAYGASFLTYRLAERFFS